MPQPTAMKQAATSQMVNTNRTTEIFDRSHTMAATDLNPSERKHGDIPELLTARELEGLLRIDVKTIYSYVQRGLIPYVRIQSNLRFVRSQIFHWITEHNYRPGSAITRRSRR